MEILISRSGVGIWDSAFPSSFQVMLTLLVHQPTLNKASYSSSNNLRENHHYWGRAGYKSKQGQEEKHYQKKYLKPNSKPWELNTPEFLNLVSSIDFGLCKDFPRQPTNPNTQSPKPHLDHIPCLTLNCSSITDLEHLNCHLCLASVSLRMKQ